MSTAALPPIKQVAHQEFEYYATAITTNTTLRIVVICLAAALLLCGLELRSLSRAVVAQKPLIIRVKEVGRAEAVNYLYNDYTPQDAEMRYFLTQFIVGFYSRNRRTLQDVYPASLYYLGGNLFNQVDAIDRKTKWAAKFMSSGDDNIDINVRNVVLDDGRKPQYRAQIDFEKLFISQGGAVTKTELFVTTVYFTVNPEEAAKHNELVKHNPLGFAIQSISTPDQDFGK